jgi:hypothetical protein
VSAFRAVLGAVSNYSCDGGAGSSHSIEVVLHFDGVVGRWMVSAPTRLVLQYQVSDVIVVVLAREGGQEEWGHSFALLPSPDLAD